MPSSARLSATRLSKFWAVAISSCALVSIGTVRADERSDNDHPLSVTPTNGPIECLPNGGGFLKARISGTIKAEINWTNANTECTGATRPSGGVRVRFSHSFGEADKHLVILFGIPALREAHEEHNLPVNVTLIREGAGQFFGTRGDDKCTIETLTQKPLVGIPRKSRTYQIVARGFCTQPARAVVGDGAVMMSRFDFSGRIDFESEDAAPDPDALAKDH